MIIEKIGKDHRKNSHMLETPIRCSKENGVTNFLSFFYRLFILNIKLKHIFLFTSSHTLILPLHHLRCSRAHLNKLKSKEQNTITNLNLSFCLFVSQSSERDGTFNLMTFLFSLWLLLLLL